MQVSVETLKGLERKITVSVPAEKVEEEVSLRLKDLARKAKIDGFRAGKVPINVVRKRYAESVRLEVAKDMVQSTLYDALKEQALVPAGYPTVEPETLESGKDFRYSAVFEVFPEVVVNELNQETVEIVHSEVTESDLETMLDKLRQQNQQWQDVDRAIAKNDKAVIDFEGFVAGLPFDGGAAEDYEVLIGSGSMIPGFEEGLIGAEPGKEFEISVTFPEDYGHEELAGKEATFQIKVKKVLVGELPELDEAFAEQFNVKEGGVEALRKEIQQNMTRELERRLSSMNREKIFDALLEKNPIDLPTGLIDQEIEHLKHEMYHRIFGAEHTEDEKIPDFPRVIFEDQAKRRVHLGLLFSEYVKKHELIADKARVEAMIEKFASAYDNPDELRSWYQGNQERMAEVEALVMEEMVADKILEEATVVQKIMDYESVMNPKQDDEDKGA